ncbi:MAG: STT3 domain-containing protein, partial [Dehalococcoidia bacterium]|nr:STT3 domain-containing protein [Dehalococcoidia bacterium]
LYGIALFIIFGIALTLRISLPYETIFTEDGVRFIGNDPWFYMRLVDNLAQTFPHRILFDPYAIFPGGSNIGIPPFFIMLLGSTIWVIGLGSPSEYIVETVGAYFPAILGAMVTIPVYFIGKELFNRNVGLLSAALIAILPGQFLLRSLLGFTDHHIAEVLFSTTAALF